MFDNSSYSMPVPMTAAGVAMDRPQPSLTERLELEREVLERRLEAINAALKTMEENPAVAETVNAIIKLGPLGN